jgi:hypothetical protein
MADKPPISNLPDPFRRKLLTGIGKGVTGAATNIIVPPLTNVAVQGISTLTKDSSNSILNTLPMTKNLLKEYYKLVDTKAKLFRELFENKEETLVYKKQPTDNRKFNVGQDLYRFYTTMIQDIEKKNTLTSRIKNKDINSKQIKELQKELENVQARLDDSYEMIEGGGNQFLTITKKQKQHMLKINSIDSQLNKIQSIAKKEKLPFNYYNDKLRELEEDYYSDVQNDELNGEPAWKVFSDMRKDNLDDIFKDKNNLAELENMHEEYLILETPEYQDMIEKEIQEAISSNTFHEYKKKYMNPYNPIDEEKILKDSSASPKMKKDALTRLSARFINDTRSVTASTIYSDSLPDDGSPVWKRDPDDKQGIYKTFQDEFTNVAKNIAKRYVTSKFIIKDGKGLKPGPWTKKLADYAKSFKTPKPPSGPTVESDEVRAKKAKVVQEVKQQPKQEVKPPRNLAQDLKGVGKRLKYSPLGATLYATEVGDAELPLETSPRGYGVGRENKGRSSRDYYKNYNTQRAI